MHNIGKMIAITIVEEAQRKMNGDFKPATELVGEIIEQYQADIGELAVEKWSLPHCVAVTVRYVNRLGDLAEDEPVAPIVSLGDAFCRTAGIGADRPEQVSLAEQPGKMRLHLNDHQCAEMYDRFVHLFETARNEFIT